MSVNLVFRLAPRPFTIAMIASEMPAAIRPYSIAVVPDSSDKKLKTVRFNFASAGCCYALSTPAGFTGLHLRVSKRGTPNLCELTKKLSGAANAARRKRRLKLKTRCRSRERFVITRESGDAVSSVPVGRIALHQRSGILGRPVKPGDDCLEMVSASRRSLRGPFSERYRLSIRA
jgi:hypothetical protein